MNEITKYTKYKMSSNTYIAKAKELTMSTNKHKIILYWSIYWQGSQIRLWGKKPTGHMFSCLSTGWGVWSLDHAPRNHTWSPRQRWCSLWLEDIASEGRPPELEPLWSSLLEFCWHGSRAFRGGPSPLLRQCLGIDGQWLLNKALITLKRMKL